MNDDQPNPTRSTHSSGHETRPAPDPDADPATQLRGGTGDGASWEPPSVLGGYRLLERIGAGGMGLVYRAEDLRLQRIVAVKVLRPELAARAGLHDRFLREGRALALVEDEHVVPVLAADEHDGLPFLVMPLLRGQNVAERLRLGAQPVAEAVRIARSMAQGLAVVHAAGLVHRDIKPANVWLDHRGGVRLMDFGLASLGDDGADPSCGLGTPAFMAPEQADGGQADQRADLYSLGRVLHALLAGNLGKPLPDGLPPALVAVCASLVASDPARRPASAAEVARELCRIESRLHAPSLFAWAAVAAFVLGTAAFALWPRAAPVPAPAPVEKKPAGPFPPLPVGWAEKLEKMDREERVSALREELARRNPGYEGQLEYFSFGEGGRLVQVKIHSAQVADLTPVAAVPGLAALECIDRATRQGKLASLEPLRGLPLQQAGFNYNPVRDLSPLAGMPLRRLWLGGIEADDFGPVYGLEKLQVLHLTSTRRGARVDAARLLRMPLEDVWLDPAQAPGLASLRSLPTLKVVNGKPAEQFWKEFAE